LGGAVRVALTAGDPTHGIMGEATGLLPVDMFPEPPRRRVYKTMRGGGSQGRRHPCFKTFGIHMVSNL